MSPQVHILDKVVPGFGPLAADIPPELQRTVVETRERVRGLVAPLGAFRQEVMEDAALSDVGKEQKLAQRLNGVRLDAGVAFDGARKAVEHVRDDAARKIQGAMFASVDGPEGARRDALLNTQREIEDLVRDALRQGEKSVVAVDTHGVALLEAGNSAHQMLVAVVEQEPIEDAKRVVLAVLRAGPIQRRLLGGEGVGKALVAKLAARVTGSDPAIAALVATKNAAEIVAATLKGDEHATFSAAHKVALGRPPVDTARKAS